MYYKIQQVICIHAIILLYFEKKITDEFFEIYKKKFENKAYESDGICESIMCIILNCQ